MAHDGTRWGASWQDGPGRVAWSPEGTREEAIAWALKVPAVKRLIFSAAADAWLPLESEVQRDKLPPVP